jgi:hypothetical protein
MRHFSPTLSDPNGFTFWAFVRAAVASTNLLFMPVTIGLRKTYAFQKHIELQVLLSGERV